MGRNITSLEKAIQQAGYNYNLIIKNLEDYLKSNGFRKESAHNFILQKIEKINKKDYLFDVVEFCNDILSFKHGGEREKFANSFYKRSLNEPTENELKAFWLIKNNKTEEFINYVKNDKNRRIEAKIFNSESMLIYATRFENLEIIQFLVDNDANIKVQDTYERDIIQIVSLNCENEVLKYFKENWFYEINRSKCLEIILKGGNVDLIDWQEVDTFGATVLHYLAATGSIEILLKLETILKLIDKGKFNIKDKAGLTCFDRASVRGNLETLKFLIDVSETKLEFTSNIVKGILEWAFYGCKQSIILWFFQNVSSIPKDVLNKNFLLHEINIKIDDENLKSFIDFFTSSSNLEKYEIQVADLNNQDLNGNTLLMILTSGYYNLLTVSMTKYLIKKGSNIKLKNLQDQSLAHIAASNGHLELLKFLHDQGLSLIDIDRDGDTPLIKSSRSGYIDIVEYLIEKTRSNLNVSNNYGFNALDVALANGHQNIAKLLTKELKSKIPRLISNLNKNCDSITCKNYLLHPLIIKMSEELKNKIFLIRGKDKGRDAFHYVDVLPWHLEELRQMPQGSNIDVTDYGKILRSGWGENPSKEIVLEMELLEEERTFFDKFKNAINKNNINMIIQSGLDKYKDYHGASLLHISAAYGRVDVIIWLFLSKYDIKTTDDCGNTALYYAALNGQYETIVLLKLFGLKDLFIGECKFLTGHMNKYLIKSNSEDFHQNILIASLVNGIKALNKYEVPIEILNRAKIIFNDYLNGIVTERNKELTESITLYRDTLNREDYLFDDIQKYIKSNY